jgi:drug/metabolite transporter superfamily protein YnfA
VVQRNELKRDSGVIIVAQRPRYTIAIGVMIVILALGAVVSETNPHTTVGRISVAAFFGVFIALCVWIWFRLNRRRGHIEVADDAIKYVHWSGETVAVLPREQVNELRIIRRLSDRQLFLYDRLVVPGTDAWINLKWFSARAVRQACLARGWHFDRGPAAMG